MVPALLGQLKTFAVQAPTLRQLSGQFVTLLGNNPLTSAGAGLALGGVAWTGQRHHQFVRGKHMEKEGTVLVGRSGEGAAGAIGALFAAFEESPAGHNLIPQVQPSANALARVLADFKRRETLDDDRLASLALGLEQVRAAKLLRADVAPIQAAWSAVEVAFEDYQNALGERLEEVRSWGGADATAFSDLADRLDRCDNFETLRAELEAYLQETDDLRERPRVGAGLAEAHRTVKTLIGEIDAQMPALDARARRCVRALRSGISLSRDRVNDSKAKGFELARRWGKTAEGMVEAQKIPESLMRVTLPVIIGLSALAAALGVRLGGYFKGMNVRWLR